MRTAGRVRGAGLALALAALVSGCVSTSPAPRAEPTSPSTPVESASPLRPDTVDLPAVPDEGLVVDVAGVATFSSFDGRSTVPLPGFQLSGGLVTGSRTWLVATDGSTWLLDTRARKLLRRPLKHDATDGLSQLQTLPRPERIGHWRFALPGPSGRLLAQWSGECETPTVYVVDPGRPPRLVSPPGQHLNAYARGWTRTGLPVVEFPEAPCGQGLPSPGLYAETSPQRYRLLYSTREGGAYYQLPSKTVTPVVPLCTPKSYRLIAVAAGETGDGVLGAEFRPTSTSPCRLETQVTFSLRDAATDAVLAVPNNPAAVEVSTELADADGAPADVIWHQPYCGGEVDLVVTDDQGHRSTARHIVRPRCDAAAGQSGSGPGLWVPH